ncbi:hypothetical protein ACGF5M_06285 [Gemmatimonadota bacterium]
MPDSSLLLRRKRAVDPFMLEAGKVFFVFILCLIGAVTLDLERDSSLLSAHVVLLLEVYG